MTSSADGGMAVPAAGGGAWTTRRREFQKYRVRTRPTSPASWRIQPIVSRLNGPTLVSSSPNVMIAPTTIRRMLPPIPIEVLRAVYWVTIGDGVTHVRGSSIGQAVSHD